MSALRIIKAFSIMGISFFLVSGAGPKPEPSTDYKATTGRIEEYIDGVPGEEDFIDLIPQVSAESL